MRISPLWLTIILAVLTGVLALAIWVPISGYFYPPGTPEGGNNTANTSLTAPASMARYMPLPPNGWTFNNSSGDVVTNDQESFSFAKDDYIMPGSNTTASVIIYDSGGKDIMWNSIFRTGFIYDDSSGYAKVYDYKGMLTWETGQYSGVDNEYSMYIKLNDRFGIAILLKNATDNSALRDFADRTNIYKIIALGQ